MGDFVDAEDAIVDFVGPGVEGESGDVSFDAVAEAVVMEGASDGASGEQEDVSAGAARDFQRQTEETLGGIMAAKIA